MGKIYLYYKAPGNSLYGDILKVKVDDSITAEVNRNDIYELELVDGMHNIKMYYEVMSSERLCGYVEQNIEINDDVYYIYKGPITIYGKGKLIKKVFNNSDEFKAFIRKSTKINKILGIILLIICILLWILL